MRIRARKTSLQAADGTGSPNTTLAQSVLEGGGDFRGVTNIEVVTRRSSIAPCVSCMLCGSFLRDATTIPECLHSFCRECVVKKFECENINSCPTCDIDMGCDPLKKLSIQDPWYFLLRGTRWKKSQPRLLQSWFCCPHLHPKLMRLMIQPERQMLHIARHKRRILGRIETYSGRSQAFEADIDRLREELENEKAEKAAALERMRVLEKKLHTESEKSKEHVALKCYFEVVQKEKLDLENQVDHLSRSLAEEKHNARIVDEMMSRTVEEKAQLKNELEDARKELKIAKSVIYVAGALIRNANCIRNAARGTKSKDGNIGRLEKLRSLPKICERDGIKIPDILLQEYGRFFTEPSHMDGQT